MARRLPPFAAVKAFEAAARFSNFQLAAAELGITASAVSHHVKSLEDFLGIELFERKNNRLYLGAEGEAYHQELLGSLDRIDEATRRISRRHGRKRLTVRLYATLVETWVMPHLGSFIEMHPDIYVRLITQATDQNNADPRADLEIKYLPEHGGPYDGTFLFDDEVVPVCSPAYLDRTGPVRAAADLVDHTLIVCSGEPDEWPLWAEGNGISLDGVSRWIELDQRGAALSAAKEGLGFAMGRRPYVDQEAMGKELAAPLPHAVPTGYGYYLFRSPITEELSEIQTFSDWLLSICPPPKTTQVA